MSVNSSAQYCGVPPALDNGYVTEISGVRYPDTAVYACFEEFTLQGSATVSCQANGDWSTPPFCNGKPLQQHRLRSPSLFKLIQFRTASANQRQLR